MLIVNVDFITDKEFSVLSLVKGSAVQSMDLNKDVSSGFAQTIDDEPTSSCEMLGKTREKAIQRMTEEATQLQADAIINVRFTTHPISSIGCEVLVYGTAIKYRVSNGLQQF